MFRCLALIPILMLGGCFLATPYQAHGFMGGVEARQLSSDTYEVSTEGNGYTSYARTMGYSMLKSAETTLATGHTHFRVISAGMGKEEQPLYTQYGVINVDRPRSKLVIQVLKSGSDEPAVYDAKEVERDMRARHVDRPKKGNALKPPR